VTLMANKISVIIDVAVDQANRGLKSFRQSIADADGAAGKFKAGASSAFSSVQANAGALALGAGAALVGFGAKSVAAFQDTALEAGRLSESLGLTTEEASRFMEVAGDMGIDVGTLEKSIGKMNIEVAKSPAYFDEIGASIAKNKDGTTDVQQTFLNVVDAINKMPDASQRAEASQKLLGRGWKDMSELVGKGADELKKSLDGVSDAKVIDSGEVDKARKFRDAMDNLQDSVEDVSLTVGEILVPALTKAAEAAADVKTVTGQADDAMGGLDEALIGVAKANWEYLNPVGQAITALDWLTGGTDEATEATVAFGEAVAGGAIESVKSAGTAAALAAATGDYSEATDDANDSTDEFAEALEEARSQWDQLLGRLNVSDAFRNIQEGFDSLETAAFEAFVAASEGAADAEAKGREYQQQIDDMTRAVLEDFIPALGNVPKEVTSSIVALIDEGKFAEAERRMAMLTASRNAIINVYAKGGDPRLVSGARAGGGPVSAGRTYLVGEKGPELLSMGSQGGNVIPNNKLGAGSNTYNITVTGLTGPQVADQLITKIKEYERRNGKGWRS
jgi:hypothetical protein